MLSPGIQSDQLKALIRMQLPDGEALEMLNRLTPEAVTLDLLEEALACLRESALTVAQPNVPVMDCCGTGGSGLSHFNTSTTVAFVLSAAGVPVVKFGNRGYSSASGSFDLLEQLGIGVHLNPQYLPEVLEECGLAFLFAPACYPTLAGFAELRKQHKKRTLFNFLGPLLNPVKPAYRLLGVSHPEMQNLMAQHLAQNKTCQQAWLAHGQDGLDELAPHGPTRVIQVQGAIMEETKITPPGTPCPLPDGSLAPEQNLNILRKLLLGEDEESVYYRMVCLNAGAGLLIAGRVDTLEDGHREAQALLKSGHVYNSLEQCRRTHEKYSNPRHAG